MQSGIKQGEPVIIGDLTAEELQKLGDLRQQSEHIVHQIGLNRVQEQRLMQQLQRTEQTAQVVLNQAGARLGIPDGTAWQVTSEGKAIMVGAPKAAPRPQVVPAPVEDETPDLEAPSEG